MIVNGYHRYWYYLLEQERTIADLAPGERAWTIGWVSNMTFPCFPDTMPVTTVTAYIERTERWYKRLWLRGLLKRWWRWYFLRPWEAW